MVAPLSCVSRGWKEGATPRSRLLPRGPPVSSGSHAIHLHSYAHLPWGFCPGRAGPSGGLTFGSAGWAAPCPEASSAVSSRTSPVSRRALHRQAWELALPGTIPSALPPGWPGTPAASSLPAPATHLGACAQADPPSPASSLADKAHLILRNSAQRTPPLGETFSAPTMES